jgi:phospholipase C
VHHRIRILGLACAFAAASAFAAPATPIQHLVVIYQENVSFDHYFASYPLAENRPGETPFHARAGTPTVDGLTGPLLTHNPNSAPPHRFAPAQATTCDQDHGYTEEQEAYDGGLVDGFVEHTGTDGTAHMGKTACSSSDVMGYFDGNTLAALWRYAQRFAMSDSYFETGFGPSTVGALNLIAGDTSHATGGCAHAQAAGCRLEGDRLYLEDELELIAGTVVGDPQPEFDDCSTRDTAALTGPNVGELMNRAGLRWGFFEGGFRPSARKDGHAICATAHDSSAGGQKADYIPHHEPFQYYASTANPHHLPPSSVMAIGKDDEAKHQYDLEDFWAAVDAGHMPEVAYLKAPAYQDGHAGYSDPVTEQRFLVETINRLERRPEWAHMAIVITYDDSDGWYDHVMPPIVRGSASPVDALNGSGRCGKPGAIAGRCGYGPRLPLLVLSPYARVNFVDHRVLDQSSIIRFIEDNWGLGRLGVDSSDAMAGNLEGLFDFKAPHPAPLVLDPARGTPAQAR